MENCLSGLKVDRPPVALWRHFPVDDQDPGRLAKAHINFQRNFDFDFVKVSPSSSFCLRDWGVKDEWRGHSEGTREYTHRVIEDIGDWNKLPILDPKQGSLEAQLECLRLLIDELGLDTPVIQTVFNPLSQAKNLIGSDELLVHMRRYPDVLHAGLEVITESTRRFVEEAQKTGIAGIFFAVQHAQYDLLSEEEYKVFGRNYDLKVLKSAQEFWFNMLHIHGKDVMFEQLSDYPVQVVNWHDRETEPSLAVGQDIFPGAVCGGLRRQETVVLGTPDEITQESRSAIEETGGMRFILGTGCVTPINAPYGNVLAARNSVSA